MSPSSRRALFEAAYASLLLRRSPDERDREPRSGFEPGDLAHRQAGQRVALSVPGRPDAGLDRADVRM